VKQEMSGKIKYRIGKSVGFQSLVVLLSATCVVPLIAILWYIIKEGITKVNWSFLTNVEKPVGEVGGGVLHALVGSLIIIVMATVIAVPIGILCGIYLGENKKGKLAYYARLCVDVLQGVPSIVIGIVAYIWLVKPFGYSAWSGGLALAIMMLPIVVRSTEETLLLLPDSLREAAYALGMPFHRVILKVIIPCGISGILSGVMLSIARISGETAPLLFTAFGCQFLSTDVTKPMETLPHLVFKYAISPYNDWKELAWGASVILLIFVLSLNLITKLITRKWKVQL
jgi:phosphate transport system permease protein